MVLISAIVFATFFTMFQTHAAGPVWGCFDASRTQLSYVLTAGIDVNLLRSIVLGTGAQLATPTPALTVDYLNSVDVFFANYIYGTGSVLSFDEQLALSTWVKNGGNLIVGSSGQFPHEAHSYVREFGLSVAGGSTSWTAAHACSGAHPFLSGVSSIGVVWPTYLDIGQTDAEVVCSQSGNAIIATLNVGSKGGSVVFTYGRMFYAVYIDAQDNERLASNIINWVALTATALPSPQPTVFPSHQPTGLPSPQQSTQPTARPPTPAQSHLPTAAPTVTPTAAPTSPPTATPTATPTAPPTDNPSLPPTAPPTAPPSAPPTATPTIPPTTKPSLPPTAHPTQQPSLPPTAHPSLQPTAHPSALPTTHPSYPPSAAPTGPPTRQPTTQPTPEATSVPTPQPTAQPTSQPTCTPAQPRSIDRSIALLPEASGLGRQSIYSTADPDMLSLVYEIPDSFYIVLIEILEPVNDTNIEYYSFNTTQSDTTQFWSLNRDLETCSYHAVASIPWLEVVSSDAVMKKETPSRVVYMMEINSGGAQNINHGGVPTAQWTYTTSKFSIQFDKLVVMESTPTLNSVLEVTHALTYRNVIFADNSSLAGQYTSRVEYVLETMTTSPYMLQPDSSSFLSNGQIFFNSVEMSSSNCPEDHQDCFQIWKFYYDRFDSECDMTSVYLFDFEIVCRQNLACSELQGDERVAQLGWEDKLPAEHLCPFILDDFGFIGELSLFSESGFTKPASLFALGDRVYGRTSVTSESGLGIGYIQLINVTTTYNNVEYFLHPEVHSELSFQSHNCGPDPQGACEFNFELSEKVYVLDHRSEGTFLITIIAEVFGGVKLLQVEDSIVTFDVTASIAYCLNNCEQDNEVSIEEKSPVGESGLDDVYVVAIVVPIVFVILICCVSVIYYRRKKEIYYSDVHIRSIPMTPVSPDRKRPPPIVPGFRESFSQEDLDIYEARKKIKQLELKLERVQDERLCVICSVTHSNVCIDPCNHICMCEVCVQNEELSNCPMCRSPIASWAKIYHA